MKSTQLENYLSQLDRALGMISASERAEIILEIKSHVLDATSVEFSKKTVGEVLEALGPAQQVANRYLLERGLTPHKPSQRHLIVPVVKWLAIGGIGICLITVLTGVFLAYKMSPVISVDDENERVTILNGFIDIDGKKGSVKVGGKNISDEEEESVVSVGKKEISFPLQSKVGLKFTNGKFNLKTSSDHQIHWNCKTSKSEGEVTLVQESRTHDYKFQIGKNNQNANCNIELPKGVSLVLNATNGKIVFNEPRFNLDVQMTNGKINLLPATDAPYRFETKVTTGKISLPESSTDKNAYLAKFNLVNGNVSSSRAE